MGITLRTETHLPTDQELVIQMGSGDVSALVTSCIRNFEDYAHLAAKVNPDYLGGLFTLSTFCATKKVSKEMILEGMPHNQYGYAPYGEVAAKFTLLPTLTGTAPAELDSVHYDILLPESYTSEVLPSELEVDELSLLKDKLQKHVLQVVTIFDPRSRK